MNEKRKRFSLLGGLGTIALIIIGLVLADWYNRPKITSSPTKLTIRHERSKGWKVEFISDIYNEGNSTAIVDGIEVLLYFNSSEGRPYSMGREQPFTIGAKSTQKDTCDGILPRSLAVNNELQLQKLCYKLCKKEGRFWFVGEYQERDMRVSLRPVPYSLNFSEIPYARYDSAKGAINYAIRYHDVIYKGKKHKIAIYPPMAEMTYEIESDSILLSLSVPISDDSLLIGRWTIAGQYVTPLVWADAEITPYLVIPKYMSLGFEEVSKGSEEIESKERDFDLGEMGKYDYWVVYSF